ncbi:hypothetical protein AV530_003747 [Patagioenas fasciata monilis]|uniref:Uncharacterized protein n=1 Tax=Patagioenas fasciata monilis TaxID=372326 RepID=A0A1V4L016_PATFA|nr:hypothetical protein AV530_003747 [Patagioenas fasciata monilis]
MLLEKWKLGKTETVLQKAGVTFIQVLDLGAAPVHLNDHTDVTTTTSTSTRRGFQDAVSCLQDNYPSLLAALENL